MTVLMETVAESGKGGVESRKYAPDLAWVWRMSRLTRDGTAEPNSRDQTLRRERGQGKSYFPCSADHEQDWQPYPVDAQSAKSDDHTHTHTVTLECWYIELVGCLNLLQKGLAYSSSYHLC